MAKKAKQEEGETPTEQPAPAPKQPNQNGVTRPRTGTATGRVWEIFETLGKEKGETPTRKDVLDAFIAEGGNAATGATQYGRATKFYGVNKGTNKKAEAPAAPEDAPIVTE